MVAALHTNVLVAIHQEAVEDFVAVRCRTCRHPIESATSLVACAEAAQQGVSSHHGRLIRHLEQLSWLCWWVGRAQHLLELIQLFMIHSRLLRWLLPQKFIEVGSVGLARLHS